MNHSQYFGRPYLAGRELNNVAESLVSGKTSGDGPFGRRCEAFLAQYFQIPHALLTTSGASATETASILCDLSPGDEVILTSFDNQAAVNAFRNRGASLRFVDIRPDTLCVDEDAAEAALTDNTRAIYVRHYCGASADLERLRALAQERSVLLIEDVSDAFGGQFNNRLLGTYGDLAILSFHGSRNVSCGDAGALLMSSDSLSQRAEIIREKGTNRSQFFRGQVDKYTWIDVGSSYVPSEVLAAILAAQFHALDEILDLRSKLRKTYLNALAARLPDVGLTPVDTPLWNGQSVSGMAVLADDGHLRRTLLGALSETADALGRSTYVSAVDPHAGVPRAVDLIDNLDVTTDIGARLLRLPFHTGMLPAQVEQVAGTLHARLSGGTGVGGGPSGG